MTLDVSVVIPCKNEERRFGTMLESLARQSFGGSWEVVVADNGSTDATQVVAESYSACLPRLVVVDASERPGPAYARNVGIQHSTGAKLLFLDADDEVGDVYVSAMAAALDSAELVCARIGFDRLTPAWALESWPARWQQDSPLHDFGFLPFAGEGTLGIRRSLFEKVGGFRPRHPPSQFEEADLSWRIQLEGHTGPVLVPEAVLYYRLPTRVSARYRRNRNYARGQLALHELYREHGMTPPRRASWRDAVGALRRVRKRSDLLRAAAVFGRLVGQRQGPSVDLAL